MSRAEADIIQGLKSLAGTASGSSAIPGKVKSVDREALTCEVYDLDGFLWHGVRLQAMVPALPGVVLIPEVDSDVIMGRLEDTDCFCVLVYSKIEDVLMKISGKYMLANEAENFFGWMRTLLDTLSQAVITTPVGPGYFAPQTVQQLENIKTRFEELFKEE